MRLTPRLKIIAAIVVLTALYLGGYAYVRERHWLVHRSTFMYGNTHDHTVDMGDMGTGLNYGGYRRAQASYVVFTPLRWLETMFWYVVHPPGKPWPY